jgi:predicted nucleic acid-binding protein
MRLSMDYDVSPYDALYLDLAEESGYAFVTADQQLYKRIEPRMPSACWIGDVRARL